MVAILNMKYIESNIGLNVKRWQLNDRQRASVHLGRTRSSLTCLHNVHEDGTLESFLNKLLDTASVSQTLQDSRIKWTGIQ